jgi:hypothetical protein
MKRQWLCTSPLIRIDRRGSLMRVQIRRGRGVGWWRAGVKRGGKKALGTLQGRLVEVGNEKLNIVLRAQ